MIGQIHQNVSLMTGSWARVYVNEIPVYKRPIHGPDSIGGPINEMLVPGENAVRVELLHTEKPKTSEYHEHAFRYTLREVLNIKPEVELREMIDLDFPAIFLEAEEKFRRYPYCYRTTFKAPSHIVEPPWTKAPPCEFGCEGTPELRDAVERMHRSMVSGDVDAFLTENELRFQHTENAFAGDADYTESSRHALFRNEAFAKPLDVQPLDFGELHFEPVQNGKIALVTRFDHNKALRAVRRGNPNMGMGMDLFLTQHEGRWMVFA